MFEDAELRNEFIVESSEHLADIENQLLTIEAAGADMDLDLDLVNTVFRAVHSIKGAAGFLGLTVINELAHHLENVLDMMREGELVPTAENIEVMLRAADTLRALIEDVNNSNEADVSCHVSALDQLASTSNSQAEPVKAISSEPSTDPTAPSPEEPETASQPTLNEAAVPTQSPVPTTDSTRDAQTDDDHQVANSKKPQAAQSSTDAHIRVPVGTLDQLMNLVGELVLGRNQLIQTASSLKHDGLDAVALRNESGCQ